MGRPTVSARGRGLLRWSEREATRGRSALNEHAPSQCQGVDTLLPPPDAPAAARRVPFVTLMHVCMHAMEEAVMDSDRACQLTLNCSMDSPGTRADSHMHPIPLAWLLPTGPATCAKAECQSSFCCCPARPALSL